MPVSPAVLTLCPLFSELAPELLRPIAEQMQMLPLRRREALNGGQAAFDGLGVVLSGQVQAVDETADGREVALITAGANDVFGLPELLARSASPLVWMASAPGTTVALLRREVALGALQKGELSFRAATLLAQRVCDTLSLQKVLTVHPVAARVCAWLMWQAKPPEWMLQIPTHAELAWQLNTTRESVTRVLQKLLADGVLGRSDAGWTIAQPDVLQELARGRRE